MSALQDLEADPSAGDPLVGRLDEVLEDLATAVADTTLASDASRIDRIARLEKLRAVTAALQAAESVRFAQSQVAEQLAADVHPDAIGRGIAEQIGLACRISPVAAARRLNTARAWWFELPDTYSQLTAGELSERVAETIVSETRHLDPETRRRVDNQLKAAGIAKLGLQAATAWIRKAAYEVDRQAYVQRGRTERKHRRVGVRPAPDTMAILTGYLPVEQGIACYAALLWARSALLWARSGPLGRGAHLRLAPPLQAPARPLRPSRRYARSVPRTRLLPRLFQEARGVI